MRNKLLILWVLIFVLTAPAVVRSECVDLGRADSHYIQGAHSVVFYTGNRPIARVTMLHCALYQDSTIRLTKTYVCDRDRIIVDGEQCVIGGVSTAVTTPRY